MAKQNEVSETKNAHTPGSVRAAAQIRQWQESGDIVFHRMEEAIDRETRAGDMEKLLREIVTDYRCGYDVLHSNAIDYAEKLLSELDGLPGEGQEK